MTTATYSYVDNATDSGSGIGWNNISDLTTSTSSVVSKSGVSGSYNSVMRLINMDTPEYMSSLDNGVVFDSMDVKFKAYNAYIGVKGYFSVTQNGIERFAQTFTDVNNSNFRTYSGNQTYWGLLGTDREIIIQLGDGTIIFHYYFDMPSSTSYAVFLIDFQIQLEYTLPDTKRASILVTMP